MDGRSVPVQLTSHDSAPISPLAQEEVESVLGVRLETLLEGRASQLQVLPVAAQGGGFSLRDRAVHVFTEAARVETFR